MPINDSSIPFAPIDVLFVRNFDMSLSILTGSNVHAKATKKISRKYIPVHREPQRRKADKEENGPQRHKAAKFENNA